MCHTGQSSLHKFAKLIIIFI